MEGRFQFKAKLDDLDLLHGDQRRDDLDIALLGARPYQLVEGLVVEYGRQSG